MALSQVERAAIDGLLADYCARRVPPSVRNELRLEHKVRGNAVTLVERRPPWRGAGEWTTGPVAQFRRLRLGQWVLFCRDRNQKWWRYEPLPAAADLKVLLAEVDRDPTGIFWG
jgi:hypothetical protein